MQGHKPHKTLIRIVRVRAESMAPQRGEPGEAVISAASTVDIPAGDFPGEDHQEVDPRTMDGDPPEAAVSEAHRALVVGHGRAGVLEAEEFLGDGSVEAPSDSLGVAPIMNNEVIETHRTHYLVQEESR